VLVALPRERLARPASWAVAIAIWCGVGVVVAAAGWLARPAIAPLQVTAAALGHGCGIVVQSPTGRVLVYDAGRLGAPAAAQRGMAALLWSGGISRIDTRGGRGGGVGIVSGEPGPGRAGSPAARP
jgi:beta-lactamase superfamily II metal-dependent hydrolase